MHFVIYYILLQAGRSADPAALSLTDLIEAINQLEEKRNNVVKKKKKEKTASSSKPVVYKTPQATARRPGKALNL